MIVKQFTEVTNDLNALVVAERTPIIELNGVTPITVLRDITQQSGTGAVTNAGAEYRLRHAASNDYAFIRSAARGRYQPGTIAQVGIGVRTDGAQISVDIGDEQIITLCARAISTTATVSAVLRVMEM